MSRMKGATQKPRKDNDKSQEIHAIVGQAKAKTRKNEQFFCRCHHWKNMLYG